MPFASKAQRNFLFTKHPAVAREFAAKTTPLQSARLPDKVQPKSKPKPDPDMDRSADAQAAAAVILSKSRKKKTVPNFGSDSGSGTASLP